MANNEVARSVRSMRRGQIGACGRHDTSWKYGPYILQPNRNLIKCEYSKKSNNKERKTVKEKQKWKA